MILSHGPETFEAAARVVGEGGLIAFRTDTFYGLGADPFNRRALEQLKTLKGRDGKPILLVIGAHEDASRFIAAESAAFKTLARAFWPGPLTLVAAARPEVPQELTAGTGTIGIRLPGDTALLELINACEGALTATSANPAGLPPARTAQEVKIYFKDALPLIVDAGEVASALPSTVVDVSGDSATMIRAGVIDAEALREALLPDGIELK